jgi:hypothetical protein
MFCNTSLMKITFKVCFILGTGTQENGKLKRGHIREKNFSSGIEAILIFFSSTEGILSIKKNQNN